ncbi:MAG: tRNA 4-thiouridine(8) synthase ThiI [Hahellaceae bacterium]|nr:tRNA 4-thiouridine(8) synthase ThiI [Hahellaceae bacterium]MCP5210675.1 tRNA 4-thiouridine(8) synthase ThiI [Hahellaceae bacterium]
MKLIVKFFPEITIKSKPVRKQQVRHLRDNISKVLKQIDDQVKVIGQWDFIEVKVPDDVIPEKTQQTIVDTLKRIPGIANFAEVHEFPYVDFDDVFQKTLSVYGPMLRGKRFVVRIKRAGKHDFTSTQLEQYVGGGLRQHVAESQVDLHNPEVTVKLEVRDDKYYVVTNKYQGLGGFPIGAIEPVLSLMSGGFDSTVASYLTIRRGLKTHFCFFSLGGTAHEVGVKQVSAYLWERYSVSHRVKFVTVPFEEVVAEILRSVHHSQMGVILKRMMLRAASEVAKEMKIDALVMGDSVAQVSSQTLPNMAIVDSVTETLVLRPLITSHKQEIIQLAEQIGTAEFARNMPEYCGVISDRPTTHAKKYRILQEEERFDFSVLEKAVAERRVVNVDEIMASVASTGDIDIINTPQVGDVIVDIRHPNETEKHVLSLTTNEVMQIPFYELVDAEKYLDKEKTYLLYCEKGTMSQLHASNLKASGYANVKVYQP